MRTATLTPEKRSIRQELKPGQRQAILPLIALGIIMLINAAMAFPHLGMSPVFDDEAIAVWYAHVAAHPHQIADLFGSFDYAVPPLYIWLGAVAQHVIADPLVALRAVSVLCGVASLAAVYALALTLYQDALVGLLAALLCTLCPYEYFFDRMALLDPLVQFIGLLIAIQSIRLFRKRHHDVAQAVLLGVLLGLGQLSKGIATFFWLLPFLAWFIYAPRRQFSDLWRSMIIATPVAAVLYAVILASGNIRNLFRPFFTAIKYSVATPYQGYYTSHPHVSIVTLIKTNFLQWLSWQQTYVGYALLTGLVLALLAGVASRERADRFLVLSLLIPLAAMLCVKIYTSRYVLFTVPIEMLLISRLSVRAIRYAQLTMLRAAEHGQGVLTGIAVIVLLIAGAAYTALFDAVRINRLFANPARATLVSDDTWQYITGWPSGYGLKDIETYIRDHARAGQVTVVAAPTHQPINALLYAFAGDSRITVRPMSLTKRGSFSTRLVFAVLDIPKDDLAATRQAHPSWRIVMTRLKPGSQSEFVLLAGDS